MHIPRLTASLGFVWIAACGGATTADSAGRTTVETRAEEPPSAAAAYPPCDEQRPRREYHFVQFAYYAEGQYGVRDTHGVDEQSDDPEGLVGFLRYTLENTPEDDGGEGPGAELWVVDGDRRDELIALAREAGVRNVRVCTDTTR